MNSLRKRLLPFTKIHLPRKQIFPKRPQNIQKKEVFNISENNYTYDEDGDIDTTTAYRPTWKEAVFNGKLGAPRISPAGSYIVVKGEFSIKEGELTAIAELGASMTYPNNTILTKSEAQALVASDVWNNG